MKYGVWRLPGGAFLTCELERFAIAYTERGGSPTVRLVITQHFSLLCTFSLPRSGLMNLAVGLWCLRITGANRFCGCGHCPTHEWRNVYSDSRKRIFATNQHESSRMEASNVIQTAYETGKNIRVHSCSFVAENISPLWG